jgi:hypothetical protein
MTYDYTHLPRHAVKRKAIDLRIKDRRSRKEVTAAFRVLHRALSKRSRLAAQLHAVKEALSDG